MPHDLTNRLDVLCKKHCTQKAFDEIQEARANTPTYDLLIDYYDFDKLWQPTLTFTQLMGDEYKVFPIQSGKYYYKYLCLHNKKRWYVFH